MDGSYTTLTSNSYETFTLAKHHAEANGTKTLAVCTSPGKERVMMSWLLEMCID